MIDFSLRGKAILICIRLAFMPASLICNVLQCLDRELVVSLPIALFQVLLVSG